MLDAARSGFSTLLGTSASSSALTAALPFASMACSCSSLHVSMRSESTCRVVVVVAAAEVVEEMVTAEMVVAAEGAQREHLAHMRAQLSVDARAADAEDAAEVGRAPRRRIRKMRRVGRDAVGARRVARDRQQPPLRFRAEALTHLVAALVAAVVGVVVVHNRPAGTHRAPLTRHLAVRREAD